MTTERNYIEYILGNSLQRIYLHSLKGFSPTTTLLQYLRSQENLKGTKEGCAEGDCGACTVILAEERQGKLAYMAANSCLILLPQIHGKQVITVEDLKNGNTPHPVQQAMVDLDASQCGFCTPGFVMSLFGLYKSDLKITDDTIMEAFSGNLCRCTGYQSILKAARKALHKIETDSFSKQQANILQMLGGIQKSDAYFEVQKQRYFQAATLHAALQWIHMHDEFEKISGATDVALRVTKKHEAIPAIIDLSQIEELKTIRETRTSFVIGSQVSLQQIKEDLQHRIPAMHKILSVFGSKQIRHLATLTGNLASASPIGDLLPLMVALDASVLLKSMDTERTVLVEDFIRGYRRTVLKPKELIVQLIIPKPDADCFIDMEKVSKRLDLDIASVSVAIRLNVSPTITVNEIKLIFGGMADHTKRARHTEAFLRGKTWDREQVTLAAQELVKDFKPIDDARASAEGRLQIAKNLLIKLWLNSESK